MLAVSFRFKTTAEYGHTPKNSIDSFHDFSSNFANSNSMRQRIKSLDQEMFLAEFGLTRCELPQVSQAEAQSVPLMAVVPVECVGNKGNIKRISCDTLI